MVEDADGEEAVPDTAPPLGTPLWQRVAIVATAVAGLLSGGAGIAAVMNAVNPSEPSAEISCTSYWAEVHELGEEGFEGFGLMRDSELEDRCGEATEVDRMWK